MAVSENAEPGRRERKLQQQRDHLADTAWALFEAEGFETVTMERIAELADVSKVTLYRYFPVKEALLRHRFHRELWQAWPALQQELAAFPAGRARLFHFLERHAAWCESRRSFLLPYVLFRMSDVLRPEAGRERSGMDRLIGEIIAQGQTAGAFRSDIVAPILTTHFQFAHLAVMLRWLTMDGLSLMAELGQMLDLFCHGMELPA